MNNVEDKLYKKKKFKKPKRQKRNVALKASIGTLLFLLVGVVCFLVGAYFAGWDIWGWFTTGQAYLVYGIVVLFLLVISFFVYKKRVGHDDE